MKDEAKKEVAKWLDHKKVSGKKREDYADQIEVIVTAVEEESLTLKDDFTFVQTLKFPVGSPETPITQLEYKAHLKVHDVAEAMRGVKGSDSDGRVLAYVSAVTSMEKPFLNELNTEDYSLCQAISIFFM